MNTATIPNQETQIAFYQNLQSRKFAWTPIKPVVSDFYNEAETLFGKCLALKVLEIPVGDFIKEASKKEFNVPNEALSLFNSNVDDELIHDQQLQYAYDTYKVTSQQQQIEANQLLQQWLDLDDHPLIKAMVLERSIFFIILPMLRIFGDTALRTISNDISRDEIVHVAANSEACKNMNLVPSKSCKRLSRQTAIWLTDSINFKKFNEKGTQDFWVKQSTQLLNEGKADGLKNTKRARVPAFFEIDTRAQAIYGKS